MQSRLITLGLRKYLVTQPRNKRNRKAMAFIRDRVAHYTKTEPENIRLSQELNTLVFKDLARSMHPVKLTVSFDKEIATVTPFVERKEKKVEAKTAAKVETAKSATVTAKAEAPKSAAAATKTEAVKSPATAAKK